MRNLFFCAFFYAMSFLSYKGDGVINLEREEKKMKQEQRNLPTSAIKAFLDFVDNAKLDFNFNLEAMKNEEGITQDYLHKLELEGLNCRERRILLKPCLILNDEVLN